MKGNSKSRDFFAEGTPVNTSGRPFSPLPSPFFPPYHLPSQEERGKGREGREQGEVRALPVH